MMKAGLKTPLKKSGGKALSNQGSLRHTAKSFHHSLHVTSSTGLGVQHDAVDGCKSCPVAQQSESGRSWPFVCGMSAEATTFPLRQQRATVGFPTGLTPVTQAAVPLGPQQLACEQVAVTVVPAVPTACWRRPAIFTRHASRKS
jgi:hypothetical protein